MWKRCQKRRNWSPKVVHLMKYGRQEGRSHDFSPLLQILASWVERRQMSTLNRLGRILYLVFLTHFSNRNQVNGETRGGATGGWRSSLLRHMNSLHDRTGSLPILNSWSARISKKAICKYRLKKTFSPQEHFKILAFGKKTHFSFVLN